MLVYVDEAELAQWDAVAHASLPIPAELAEVVKAEAMAAEAAAAEARQRCVALVAAS